MGKTPPFFIFLRARPFFFMGWAFLTFKGLIPYCNFEPQHPGSLNAQEKKWDDQATKTKRNKSWSQLQPMQEWVKHFVKHMVCIFQKGIEKNVL